MDYKSFQELKKEIHETILKLNVLQDRHVKQVGKKYAILAPSQIRPGRVLEDFLRELRGCD